MRAQRGFSYLWLLLLIAILGFGLTIASEFLVTAQQRDKERELLAIGHQFRQAIASYYEFQNPAVVNSASQATTATGANPANRREYPSSLDNLLLDERSLVPKRHLRKIFVDPMSGKSEWGLYKQGGRIVGIFSLSEKEPIKVDGFEANDGSFRQKTKYSEWIFAYPSDFVDRERDNKAVNLVPAPAGSVPLIATKTNDLKVSQ
jgi:type II secretory pathway pseudopilin PulG